MEKLKEAIKIAATTPKNVTEARRSALTLLECVAYVGMSAGRLEAHASEAAARILKLISSGYSQETRKDETPNNNPAIEPKNALKHATNTLNALELETKDKWGTMAVAAWFALEYVANAWSAGLTTPDVLKDAACAAAAASDAAASNMFAFDALRSLKNVPSDTSLTSTAAWDEFHASILAWSALEDAANALRRLATMTIKEQILVKGAVNEQ